MKKKIVNKWWWYFKEIENEKKLRDAADQKRSNSSMLNLITFN